MHRFDAITAEALRSSGSMKWTTYPDAIGAFVAESDFGVDPEIAVALHAAVDRGLVGYLPPAERTALAEACADFHRLRFGWEIDPGDVHPIGDVISALELTLAHFSAPGSKVVVPTPAYMPFLEVPLLAGREIVEVPFATEADGRSVFDLEALDAAFADGGGLLVLTNPHNPLGRVFTREELSAVSEVVERHGARVFADEIHAPMVYPGAVHVPYASISEVTAGHTVTATSASKAWNLPGLKCAQLILSNAADVKRFRPLKQEATIGAGTLGVVANAVAYRRGGPWLDEVVEYLDGNRRLLAERVPELLPGVRMRQPEGTYIAWLDCRELGLGEHPARFFRKNAGVVLTNGIDCGEAGAGFARLIFATPRPILEEMLTRMAAALDDLSAR
ncbi:MalY/PatB family protein [Herbiconiux solani]|uniref:MalY/PatB family protein n=1 Tax=Herbiconiux solani TaxID=661329 RepID=UPI000824CF5D|nr:aminotransferase class I/II-fold pyridoxal phosphate-dependent enzyme [Herbiconiux solani]